MQPEVKKYLLDNKISIDSIFEFLGEDCNFENYCANKLLSRAVEEGTGNNWLIKFQL